MNNLNNQEIINKVEGLIQKQREGRSELIKHLIEFDKRQLHLALGFSGLFSYLVNKHKFSESSAYRYSQTVKVAKLFPVVIEDLNSGSLSLSNLTKASKKLLSNSLTSSEKVGLLDELKGVAKKEVEKILAPKVKSTPKEKVQTLILEEPPIENNTRKKTPTPIEKPSKVVLKTITFTVKESTYEKLERAKEVLSGKYPKGALTSEVFEEAIELLLEKKCPKRKEKRVKKSIEKVQPKQPNKSIPQKRRALSAKIKREVLAKDNYRCSYKTKDGKVCGSKNNLHFDHILPVALGGDNSSENIRLLCRQHNLFEAGRLMGEKFIKEKIKKRLSG